MTGPTGHGMISVDVAGTRFHLRAGGVCVHEGRVLVHQAAWEPFVALPGGRIEAMEASEAALRREMREELGTDITIERLLWIVENFFVYQSDAPQGLGFQRGQSNHTVELHYLFSLPPNSPIVAATEPFACLDVPDLIYRWEPLDKLDVLDLRPRFLKQALRALPTVPTHIVNEGR